MVAPKRRNVQKDFCSDKHRAAYRDATIAAQIKAAEDAIAEAGHAIVDMRDEMDRQLAKLTGALAMLERCRPKRLRDAAQSGTENDARERKGIDSGNAGP